MSKIQEVRKENAAVIAKFFAPKSRMAGGAKYRAEFFAEGGLKQQCYPICEDFPDEPDYVDARGLLMNQPDVNVGLNLDAVIYTMEDPSIIWAETTEYGEIELCGKRRPFHGHSNHIFHLENGKITVWRYFPNPYTLRDSLEMPFQKLPRFDYEEAVMQRYLKQEDPMHLVDIVEPDTTGGMQTRIRILDEYRDSLEDEKIRKHNARVIFQYFGERVILPGGKKFRTSLYHEDGYTTVPYPHQDPTAELPNLFWEHHIAYGEPDPDLRYFIDCMYPTCNPNVFWMETKTNGWPPIAPDGTKLDGYWNHYTNYFEFKDGKVYHMREFYDPSKERKIKGTNDTPLPEEAVDFYRYL